MAFDRAKALLELRKIQAALAKEVIEVETGNGAVRVKMNGEQKVQDIHLDENLIDFDDIAKLEKWLESAVTQAITKSQQAAAEKMKTMGGGLGLPGL
jgi:nucleoid-associated protein EbfC